jgi:hypothetical protein
VLTLARESKLGAIEGCPPECPELREIKIPAGVAELSGGANAFRGFKFLRAWRELQGQLKNAREFCLRVNSSEREKHWKWT